MSKWHGGKGDEQRPTNRQRFAENYEAIFNKKANAVRFNFCPRCGKRLSGNPDWVHTCTPPEGYESEISFTALQIKASQRDELLEALELLIDDLALSAKLRGDDCLDVSDGRLYKAQKAIAKAKGESE